MDEKIQICTIFFNCRSKSLLVWLGFWRSARLHFGFFRPGGGCCRCSRIRIGFRFRIKSTFRKFTICFISTLWWHWRLVFSSNGSGSFFLTFLSGSPIFEKGQKITIVKNMDIIVDLESITISDGFRSRVGISKFPKIYSRTPPPQKKGEIWQGFFFILASITLKNHQIWQKMKKSLVQLAHYSKSPLSIQNPKFRYLPTQIHH